MGNSFLQPYFNNFHNIENYRHQMGQAPITHSYLCPGLSIYSEI